MLLLLIAEGDGWVATPPPPPTPRVLLLPPLKVATMRTLGSSWCLSLVAVLLIGLLTQHYEQFSLVKSNQTPEEIYYRGLILDKCSWIWKKIVNVIPRSSAKLQNNEWTKSNDQVTTAVLKVAEVKPNNGLTWRLRHSEVFFFARISESEVRYSARGQALELLRFWSI